MQRNLKFQTSTLLWHLEIMLLLITAGPACVALDCVRTITNRATGQTGKDLADYAASRGHQVRLITSRFLEDNLSTSSILKIPFETSCELAVRFQEQIHNWQPDAIIHSAAVGDFHVDRIEDSLGKTINPSKLDSSNGPYLVRFIAAPKLLDKIKGLWGYNGVLIGFKLESGLSDPHLWEEARKTCQRSGADLMVANHLENASSIAWIGPDKSGIFNVCPRKFLAFELIHCIEFLVSNFSKKK